MIPNVAVTNTILACPTCGLLHEYLPAPVGFRAQCQRCHRKLYFPRRKALARIGALAMTEAILMIVAIFFPFLSIDAGGSSHQSSIFETALAFSQGLLMPLSALVLVLIILLPLMRVAGLIYVLRPLSKRLPPARYARLVFRFVETTQPWSMVEIYVVGAVVALIKVVGIAVVTFGPAFWAFAALVVILTFKDNMMCYWTVWRLLDPELERTDP